MKFATLARTLCVLAFSVTAAAQTSPASPSHRILAIGSLTSPLSQAERGTMLPLEVKATVKLYLDGKIEQWWFREDGNGPVFLLNVSSVDEANALLDKLPLGVAKKITFQFTPVGPLKPLQMLLSDTPTK